MTSRSTEELSAAIDILAGYWRNPVCAKCNPRKDASVICGLTQRLRKPHIGCAEERRLWALRKAQEQITQNAATGGKE